MNNIYGKVPLRNPYSTITLTFFYKEFNNVVYMDKKEYLKAKIKHFYHNG